MHLSFFQKLQKSRLVSVCRLLQFAAPTRVAAPPVSGSGCYRLERQSRVSQVAKLRPVPLTPSVSRSTRECRPESVTHSVSRWGMKHSTSGSGRTVRFATGMKAGRTRSSAGSRKIASSGWPCPSSMNPPGTGGSGLSSTLLGCFTGEPIDWSENELVDKSIKSHVML